MTSRFSILFLTAVLLLLAGCTPAPESYPPPFQRNTAAGAEAHPVSHFVAMNDPNAEVHFVRDIASYVEGQGWRWTYRRPELKFWVDSVKDQKFVMDFSIPQVTFAKTGPVTVSFFVNERLLGRMKCPRYGDFHFEKAVPAAWLRTDGPTLVAAEADKLFAAENNVQLGFILTRAGFPER